METTVNHAEIIRSFEDADFNELISALEAADDHYHNTGEPIVEDNEYDVAKRFAENSNPAHVYFTGVGSTVRGGKIKLPYQMGSLDQVEVGEIADWVRNWNLKDERVVVTDKLDGTSAMIVYNDLGELQIAYSRGNGIEGADITRHISRIPSVPRKVAIPGLVVRAEVIISTENFKTVQSIQPSRSGSPYKNPRNAVAGIMNAKTNNRDVYQYIDVIAYEMVKGAGTNIGSKQDHLENLEYEGFMVAPFGVMMGTALTDENLTDYLNSRRHLTRYEIDGLVLDVDSKSKRDEMNPTRSTLNPAYAVKYKVASADNIKNVRVIEVEWNVSKHGYYKPRVRIEPTELMGVTIQHATGFNAKFIADNSIGKGAVITITRSGDVRVSLFSPKVTGRKRVLILFQRKVQTLMRLASSRL
jgi:NAD-dependent DNA ligase